MKNTSVVFYNKQSYYQKHFLDVFEFNTPKGVFKLAKLEYRYHQRKTYKLYHISKCEEANYELYKLRTKIEGVNINSTRKLYDQLLDLEFKRIDEIDVKEYLADTYQIIGL